MRGHIEGFGVLYQNQVEGFQNYAKYPAYVNQLNADWIADWSCTLNPEDPTPYASQVYKYPKPGRLPNGARLHIEQMQAYPGHTWIGQNEPDMPDQADLSPQACAIAYNECLAFGANMITPTIALSFPHPSGNRHRNNAYRWLMEFCQYAAVEYDPDAHPYDGRTFSLGCDIYHSNRPHDFDQHLERLYAWADYYLGERKFPGGSEPWKVFVHEHCAWGNNNVQRLQNSKDMIDHITERLQWDERLTGVGWMSIRGDSVHKGRDLVDQYGRLTAIGEHFRDRNK